MPKLPRGMYRIKGRTSYYTRIYQNGRERWRSLGPDYERAKELLHRERREFPPGDRVTVREAALRWFGSYVQNRRGPGARQCAERRIRNHLKPCLGDVRLDRLTGEDVSAYRTWLDKRGLKPGTVSNSLNDLRCMLRWAVGCGLIRQNPFPSDVMPKMPELVPRGLSPEQVEALLAIPEPDAFAVRLGLGTGLRWGEMCRAHAEHLKGEMLLVPISKSGKVRRVPVVGELLNELRQRIGKLLPYEATNRNAQRVFVARVQRRSGVNDFGTHRLRHTYAYRWVTKDGNPDMLRRAMGHASLEMTQRYIGLNDGFVLAEARKVIAR